MLGYACYAEWLMPSLGVVQPMTKHAGDRHFFSSFFIPSPNASPIRK